MESRSLREESPTIVERAVPLAAGFMLAWFVPLAFGSADLVKTVHATLYVLAALSSLSGCGLAAWAAHRHERAGWLMLGLGALLMMSGDLLSTLSGGVLRQPLSEPLSLQGLLWVGAYLPYVVAFGLFLQSNRRSMLQRAHRASELLLLVLLVFLVLYTAVLYPLYGRGTGRSLESTLLFFVSLAVSLSLLIHIVSTRPRLRPWHPPLIAALAAVLIGSAVDVFDILNGLGLGVWSATSGLPWYAGYVLVGISGFERYRFRSTVPRNYSVVLGSMSAAWGTGLSAAAFVLLPVFVYVDSLWVGELLGDLSFSVLIGMAAVIAIARNLIIAMENSSLRKHATTDPLSGLYNHRHFHERLDAEVRRAERNGGSLSVVAMDVDHFDRVNNVYGHSAGDRRLRSIAERLVGVARSTDMVFRVGGDEFSIIMPDTDPLDAYKLCLRLQDYLVEPDGVCPLAISLSMGIASLPEHARSAEEIVQRADGALYWAKFHGRGQIVIYDAALVRSLGPEERIARLEEESYVNMVQLLSSAVDARDPYTHHHSRRVAELSVALAAAAGLSESVIASLETAALLHDVGKIGVPDAILRKPDRLTAQERGLVNEHPHLATRILAAIPRQEILPWIAAHHERWDGTGYPAGLSGDSIPLPARIIALCDAYDAMMSDRPYRSGLSEEQACEEIRRCAGSQFDPQLAAMFAEMLETRRPEAVA